MASEVQSPIIGEYINKVKIGEVEHPIDAVTLDGKSPSSFQTTDGLVTNISSTSDDEHYPSAKCVWGLVEDVETLLSNI